MPKRLSYLLTLLLGLLACYGFMAAKAPAAAKQYDYISVTLINDELQISSAPDNLQVVKFKSATKGYDGSFGALFAKVNELEAQGYELVSNSVYRPPNAVVRNYFLLRKPKE